MMTVALEFAPRVNGGAPAPPGACSVAVTDRLPLMTGARTIGFTKMSCEVAPNPGSVTDVVSAA